MGGRIRVLEEVQGKERSMQRGAGGAGTRVEQVGSFLSMPDQVQLWCHQQRHQGCGQQRHQRCKDRSFLAFLRSLGPEEKRPEPQTGMLWVMSSSSPSWFTLQQRKALQTVWLSCHVTPPHPHVTRAPSHTVASLSPLLANTPSGLSPAQSAFICFVSQFSEVPVTPGTSHSL